MRYHCQLKIFGALGHQRLNVDGSIYIRNAAPPYFAGIVIIANVYGRLVKTPVLFFGIWYSFVELKTVTKQAVFISPIFGGGIPHIFDMRLQIWITFQRRKVRLSYAP